MPVEPLPCGPEGGGGGPDGGCCSPAITSSALCLPDGTPVLLVVRSGCADCGTDAGAPEVAGWIAPATGEFTAGPAPEGAGPCAVGGECASVAVLPLCDMTVDGCTRFIRHLVHDCDGTVTATVDTGPDGVTPYTPTGDVGDCADCPCEDTTKVVPLCDHTHDSDPIPFLRWLTYECDTGHVTDSQDTELDGQTPYTPVGKVAECDQPCGQPAEPCEPPAMCAQLLGLSGPEEWAMPEGTESLSLTVACGPITVTDCTGHATVINECGTSFSWAAPGGPCAPGRLCTPLTVTVPEGAAVYINFLGHCGDES